MKISISMPCLIILWFLPIASVTAFELTSQGSVYDLNSEETPIPSPVILNNLLNSPKLDGDYIHILNSTNCSTCDYSLADRSLSGNFIYAATTVEFSEVMAYYHMNKYHDYVVNLLGFSLAATALPVDVFNTSSSGATYTPDGFGTSRKIILGTTSSIDTNGDWINDLDINVNMANSAAVLVHEFAHSVIDDLSPLSFYSIPYFMQEAWADYLTASYLNDVYIGKWTDKASFRGYRRSVVEGVSEYDLWPQENIRSTDGIANDSYTTGRRYYNSLRWSGFLWRLRERIYSITGFDDIQAAQLADSLILKGIELFVDTNGVVDGPINEMNDGIVAIKSALLYFQTLPAADIQYNTFYSSIADSDIDAAFYTRYRKSIAGIKMNWNKQSLTQKEKSWTHQTGRKDITVAIIDDGIYSGLHTEVLYSEDINFNGILDANEDLNGDNILNTGNLYINKGEIPNDQIDNDNNGYVDDVSGWDYFDQDPNPTDIAVSLLGSHGTEVTRYFSGSIWNASILTLRNRDSNNLAYFSANHYQTEAFSYAIKNNANLINISAGYFGDTGNLTDVSQTFQMAAFNQIQKGLKDGGNAVIVIAAAGNTGQDSDQMPIYSANFPLPNVIAVTQTDLNDVLSNLVAYGKYNVDLSATVPGGTATSYAAPQVTSALALLLSEQQDRQEAHPGYRSLSMGEIKYLLLISVDHLQSLENITVSEGRLNINKLLTYYENDADWDGYSATIEALFGTDPLDPLSYPDILNGDADGDGLVNHLELAYGTVPIKVVPGVNYSGKLYPIYLNNDGSILNGLVASDSDQDGLSDLLETQIMNAYYTDPANPDTDADGIIDGSDVTPSNAKITLANIALNTSASASDTRAFTTPAQAIDGDESTFWSTDFNTNPPHWLNIDLNKASKIYAIKTIFDNALRIPSEYTLQFSKNGDFNTGVVYEFPVRNNTSATRTDVLPIPVSANFVRLLITDPTIDGVGDNFVRVREIEILATQPTNIASGKPLTQSDFYYIYDGAKAIDGNVNTFWATDPASGSTHWLSIDLQGATVIEEISVNFDNNTVIPGIFKLQFSNTGNFLSTGTNAPYEIIIDNTDLTSNKPVKFRTPISARHVRLIIENAPDSNDYMRVREFTVNGTIH